MTYIVQRKDRFYVVAYDGIDPLTGRERRRWHPVGNNRGEAEAVAARLDSERDTAPPPTGGPITVGTFLTATWLPQKRRHVLATTAYRYAWFVERYINPAVGDIPLRRLRSDHLDELYESLDVTGGRTGAGRVCHASGSTIYATRTHRCSLPLTSHQGRERAPRPRVPGVHDAHLPAPPARHERGRRRAVRRPRRLLNPVDVYRLRTRQRAGQHVARTRPGRRRR
jgi:hypothetical protein